MNGDPVDTYRGDLFPLEIIQLTVWMYARFTLSLRDVEELLAKRGLDISYETVRRWFLNFGQVYARYIRQTRHWFLDEMVVVMRGRKFYLWRTVDCKGEVFGLLVQRRRNARAAVHLLRKHLKKQGFAPSMMVIDKLGSYGAAKIKLSLGVAHDQVNTLFRSHRHRLSKASYRHARHNAFDL